MKIFCSMFCSWNIWISIMLKVLVRATKDVCLPLKILLFSISSPLICVIYTPQRMFFLKPEPIRGNQWGLIINVFINPLAVCQHITERKTIGKYKNKRIWGSNQIFCGEGGLRGWENVVNNTLKYFTPPTSADLCCTRAKGALEISFRYTL